MSPTTLIATTVRPARPDDADACGRIFYDAFAAFATSHDLPIEPASPEFTRFTVGRMLASGGYFALVAERDGAVVGSAFMDERGPIAGIGPVSVSSEAQGAGVGRALMEACMTRAAGRGFAGTRLVQTAYNYRSLTLYARLGFVVREPLSVVAGTPPSFEVPGLTVRAATRDDLAACDAVCTRVHGHARTAEVGEAIGAGTARVAARSGGGFGGAAGSATDAGSADGAGSGAGIDAGAGAGEITGYATGLGYGWHAVGLGNADLRALLASAESYLGLGVLIPSRNAPLLRWCLENGLRIVQQSTLMTTGLYSEPAGAWMPSIAY